MYATRDDLILADLLPGEWTVAATNLPFWLAGANHHPRFSYELIGHDPLVLADEVSFLTADGEQQISGRNVEDLDGFTRRGTGWLRFFASHWAIAGVSADRTVIALRYSKSLVSPAGIEILVRSGVSYQELRAMVAGSTERFGLSPEDFGSLSWLELSPTG